MKVKICGLLDGDNIREVEYLKPDMVGFICWPGSKRFVGTRPSYLPQVERVGVFVNPTLTEISEAIERLGLNRLQLHGDESPHFCRTVRNQTGLSIIKALPIREAEDVDKALPYTQERAVDLLLFDTKCSDRGGSGCQFDWKVLQRYTEKKPFLLSGGIGPDDAERVLMFQHPAMAGIDINSRFETAPGIKDIEKLKTFLSRIRKQ